MQSVDAVGGCIRWQREIREREKERKREKVAVACSSSMKLERWWGHTSIQTHKIKKTERPVQTMVSQWLVGWWPLECDGKEKKSG
ncbi:MAG: hypothetical protein BYD32DRAFT_417428 [Podila humilis]|nr:MAG: hypothetical protein BYD32DRAFT_417428 [Podila humilis]